MSYRRMLPAALIAILLLAAPLAAALAAGGTITGTVTDPKGAVVVGATVAVTDAAGNQAHAPVTTDAQGRYRIDGLPAGAYVLVISAPGFKEARREQVRVEEGKSASADVKLEIASVELGTVEVRATGAKANDDPTYQKLRKQGGADDFTGEYATVSNLVLRRDAAVFTLRSGEVYFLPAVDGRVTGAVFMGDGELSLTPPVDHEKRSLAIFTGQPYIKEQFNRLTLRFTDKTYEEIKASPQARMSTGGPQSQRARDLYRDNQTLLRARLRTNMELRTLIDLYTPERPGFMVAFVGGQKYEKLVFEIDPLGVPEVSPEEVLLSSYGETDGGLWTAFHLADEYRAGKGNSDEDHRIFDITRHEIDAAIKGTQIGASDVVTFRAQQQGARVLPFSLFGPLRVGRVRDDQGRDLQFIQEPKGADADFAVIWPEKMEAGKEYKVTIEYAGGGALSDEGGGNFFLGPRLTWFPNNSGTQFGDRARFDITFHYPKTKKLIGTGNLVEPEAADGDYTRAKWSSGETELAVAGFNYGDFQKKERKDADTGYNIEFYANRDVNNAMKSGAIVGDSPGTPATPGVAADFRKMSVDDGSMDTTGAGDSVMADAQNSTRIYSAFFGKMPFTRIAMTQQPNANFGQAWPTLVYMPYTAFMDATQRLMSGDSIRSATSDFFEIVGPHEVAHQWWGHAVGWKSYRDQWMSEGFAVFSSSLFLQMTDKDINKFITFWEKERQKIIQPRAQTMDRKPYTVGPVTQGYRLNSRKTGGVAQFSIYPKGAYILHMIRMMMFDRKTGDKRFSEMMHDFVKTNFNKDVSTEDFKRAVEKYMTDEMDMDGNRRMDWFFNEYVYGTEMPSYRFDYSLDGNTLTGRVTQSGVSDQFVMLVPVYVDFGKGWTRLGSATIRGNSTTDLGQIKLPQAPKRVALAPLKDVLALGVENAKK